MKKNTKKKILANTLLSKETGCIIYLGYINSVSGYPETFVNSVKCRVHRFIAGARVGDRSVVRHTCDTPSCINPEHLIIGTQKENMYHISHSTICDIIKNRTWKHVDNG